MEMSKYITLLPQILMDDSVKEYSGFNPEKGVSEPIILKKEGELWIHSAVYGLLEENEMMDDLMDYFADYHIFQKIIIFDEENQSVIRLDY